SLFRHEGNKLYYDSDEYDCLQGIDVSHHQGKIDWNKVKDQGYDFTIVRIGYRGYGKEGSLNADREYLNNLNGAREAGLKTGVYFFAQAINEEEALEEADFVLMLLKDLEIDLPVVYDPESILDDIARTDNISGEQFTKNARVFCDRIKEAGYEPMIYSNMLWEAFELDLTKLSDIEIWYADYEALPQTPYHFKYWQYSNEGRVEGIRGDVDLDIMLKEK
ncbi:MAG: glycoside hydrolase family 25 protein, partial [Lachnospiraceae bacterium]|nr:glycoside hydrolase family 25 protein [Lachnospiraceae bacterium]